MNETVHEIYAVKFGANEEAKRGHFFMGAAAEPHDAPAPIDYVVWAIRSPGQDVVVESGFTAETNQRKQRTFFEEPSDALRRLGVDPERVEHLILSHLHFDHAGGVEQFPNATVHLQAEELAFWTGKYAPREEFKRTVEVDDVLRIVRLNYEGRVDLVEGTKEIVDGIWVHHAGGHTPGMQFVSVRTSQGIVVLACDASHFFENIERDRPFAVHHDLEGMYRTFDAMHRAATSRLVVPGHDPELFARFDAVEGLEGRALRIA